MLSQRLGISLSQENPLWISWHDSAWIPSLNPSNIMDYFAEKSNPFYDRTCNNENVKMQRQSLDQLNNMTGTEYILLHVQEPILYVIRKQHRHSPTEATPLADYYIIAGIVYQAPDLANVFNSRLLSTVHHLQAAFEETSSYARYHPGKGYSWDFSSNKSLEDKSKSQSKKDESKTKEEPSSIFQRQRVDMLLGELLRKFPLPAPTMPQQQQLQQNIKVEPTSNEANETSDLQSDVTIKQEFPERSIVNGNPPSNENSNSGIGSVGPVDIKDVKVENINEMKPPPEKRMKM